MKDKLPFEQPLKDVLMIYAKRWFLWLLVVIMALSPLLVVWAVKCENSG